MIYKDRVIGLDIGEASIGWAVIDNTDKCIVDMGVRCWNKSEDRNGNPLSRKRREDRGRRKVIRRKAHRKQRLKNTLLRYNMLTKEQLENLFKNNIEKDVYTLRVEGLERLLSNEELSRVLIRLSKNRGFKSNRKSDKEAEGVLNDAISENEQLMKEKCYKTVGQMLLFDEKFKQRKKNTEGDYIATVSRKSIEDEISLILKYQQKVGNTSITDTFINDIIRIIIDQRPFAKGEDILKLVGKCTFENEKRAPKATYSFSEFQVRQALNNLRLLQNKTEKIELNKDEKEMIYNKIFSGSGKFTYGQIRKTLKLESDVFFNKLSYEEDIEKVEKEVFVNIEQYIKIHKKLKDFKLNNNQLDNIGLVLSFYKTDKDIKEQLLKENLNDELIQTILDINIKTSKPCHLSLTALRKINKGLKEGLLYNEACEKGGYDFKAQNSEEEKTYTLENKIPMDDITNPTVRKALIESRNVLNAIINKYGSPTSIHIELTREVGKSDKVKFKIAKQQNEIKKLKNNIEAEIKKDRPDINLNSTQILKLRLWKEQEGRCIYSNKAIDLDYVLFDETVCQIDHILPYSRSFDNSYNNKVLTLTKENQEKRNQTPYEMFTDDRWSEFETRVTVNKDIPYRKKINLLKKDFLSEEKGFLNRSLNNTSYITDFFSKYIRENLKFAPSDKKKKVVCVNGRITSDVRYLLGFEKNREIDTHHAVDAVIVATIGDDFIQQISKYYKQREENRYKAKREGLKKPIPWENFEYEVKNKVNKIFVSRPEKIKYTGSAHDETIYSYKGKDENGYYIIGENVNVDKLNIDKNGDLSAGKSGKMDKSHPLYNVIYKAIENNEDLTNLKTPSKKGNPNSIRKIMVYRSAGSGNITILNDGKSAKLKGDMCRTDIFEKEGKYYCVPIYVSDIAKTELPNKAIKFRKPKQDWIEMDESYKFKHSIGKGSVIKFSIKEKGEIKEYLGYTVPGLDVDSIRISIRNIDRRNFEDGKKEKRFSVGKIENIKKYNVDMLGNLEEVKYEERKSIK